MTGSFHRSSAFDRLYVKRKDGGRDLKSFEDSFICRIVGLAEHLERDRDRNHFLRNVYEHEEQRIIRLAKDYEEVYHREQEEESSRAKDQMITKRVINAMNKEKKERWQ